MEGMTDKVNVQPVKMNMSAGKLKDWNLIFVRKFRWTLSGSKLDRFCVKNVKFDYFRKIIDFDAYEICENGEIAIHNFLESDLQNEKLVFSAFSGCGDHLYSYEFSGIFLLEDTSDFDYELSDVSCRKVKFGYNSKKKIIPDIVPYISENNKIIHQIDHPDLNSYRGKSISVDTTEVRHLNDGVVIPGKIKE